MDKVQNSNSRESAKPRICIFSQRRLQRLVSRCAEYEFEDIICEVDNAELLTPEPRPWFKLGEKVAKRLAQHFHVSFVNPGIGKLCLDNDYDAFVMICQFPRDLVSINAIGGWQQRCRTSVCWLSEIWACEVPKLKNVLKVLSQFDHVVIPCSGSVHAIENVIGKRCVYMPPGIDTVQFCPYPNPPVRCVDVYSLGRKSMVTHQSLSKLAEQGKIFYIYDTIDCGHTVYPSQHRSMVANIAKRSRYFIANVPKIDRHFETQGQREISYRFFEGAAAGTVMIGEPREGESFRKHFNWPDVVIHMPYNTIEIAEVLADLDSQPARLATIRKNNVVQSLLRHDWVYRWRDILELIGLEPTPALLTREERLKELAKCAEKAS